MPPVQPTSARCVLAWRVVWEPSGGEILAERFRLERELGRGGMGLVWRAHHLTLDVACAVKFVSDEALRDSDAPSRFQQEARASAKLRSRNVVQMLDYGVWRGRPYLAMELLEGEDLAERLKRRRKLSVAETLAIMHGVSRALQSAAQLGIVHRDLKPENVFIAREMGEEIAKVLDFGIAKFTDARRGRVEHRTQTGALLGTPHYMSPEQVDGTMAVDGRSDLWSLSVITYECLTGQLPFQSNALGNLFMRIMTAPLPVPSHVAPELPPEFDAWWARAADRDIEGRYPHADAWYEALDGALASVKAHAPPRLPSLPDARVDVGKTTLIPPEVNERVPQLPAHAGMTPSPPSSREPTPLPGKTLGPQVRASHNQRPRRTATVAVVAGLLVVASLVLVTVRIVRRGEGVVATVDEPASPPEPRPVRSSRPAAPPAPTPPSATEPTAVPSTSSSAAPSASASSSAVVVAPPPRPRPPRPAPSGKFGPSVME
jgi:serine/threonine protein kinase